MSERKPMSPMEIISVMENVLDKLAESTGRRKCGYICVLSDLLDNLKEAVNPKNMQISIEAEECPADASQE